MAKLNKNEIQKTLEGYKKGEALIKKERFKELRNLSPEESISIYANLWKTWQKSSKKNIEKLDQIKIKELTDFRNKIDKLARWKQSA